MNCIKTYALVIFLMLFVGTLSSAQNYNFYGTMSRDQLELYLSRSISMSSLVEENACLGMPPCINGNPNYNPSAYSINVNMLANINARFIGRTCGFWGTEDRMRTPYYINAVSTMVNDITNAYAALGRVKPIVQAGIFEIISTYVNLVPMSSEVSRAYGIPIRNFSYNDMIYTNGYGVNQWGANSSVPDMSRIETQMWFYFVATQFIDNGIEAIHLGQVNLMDRNDPLHVAWWDLVSKIRNYASTRNRGVVLLDAHTFGCKVNNTDQLLFDFHSYPTRMENVTPHWPAPATNGGWTTLDYSHSIGNNYCEKPYKNTIGGRTYFGWYATTLPYIVELDNYGNTSPDTYTNCGAWGWDEITWFGLQTEENRNTWLKYAYYKVRCLDENGYLEMPGKRGMATNPAQEYRASMSYHRQENTIDAIWNGAYAGSNNWIHHNFTNEQVYNKLSVPNVNSSLIFVGTDRAYYIANDGYIHGYINDQGIWWTVSPSVSAQTNYGQNTSSQMKADMQKTSLVASPDGNTLLYIGRDGYIHGFNVHNVWDYEYFDFMKNDMISQTLIANGSLIYPNNDRVYYIAKETVVGETRVHGFIKNSSVWSTVSPTYASQVLSTSMTQASGALTYDALSNRIYYVGIDKYLYYYYINNVWSYTYSSAGISQLASQSLKIVPYKLAISGNRIYYVGLESSGARRIHALIDNGSWWNTISPTYSAIQNLALQVQATAEIAVSPNGSDIAYIGTDNKVHFYHDISYGAGMTYSYSGIFGSPPGIKMSNSLQYKDNDHLYCVSALPPWPPTTDYNVHSFICQTSYCGNGYINSVEPLYVYNRQVNPNANSDTVLHNNNANHEIASNVQDSFSIVPNARESINGNLKLIKIYPNPAKDLLYINNLSANKQLAFFIVNAVGVKVMESMLITYPVAQMDISQLRPGIYHIKVYNHDGLTLSDHTFLKE